MYTEIYNAADNGAGSNTIPLNNFRGNGTVLVQASYLDSATGTVTIAARVEESHNWVDVTTMTADDLQAIIYAPFIRATITGHANGNIVVGLHDLG